MGYLWKWPGQRTFSLADFGGTRLVETAHHKASDAKHEKYVNLQMDHSRIRDYYKTFSIKLGTFIRHMDLKPYVSGYIFTRA